MFNFWPKILNLSGKELDKEGEDLFVTGKRQIVFPRLKKKQKSSQNTNVIKIEKAEGSDDWMSLEKGELRIDLYETPEAVVIESAIAGVNSSDLEISVEADLIRIKGKRPKISSQERKYFYQECFWGTFSKTIILPTPINQETTKGVINNGILVLTMPKKQLSKNDFQITENE